MELVLQPLAPQSSGDQYSAEVFCASCDRHSDTTLSRLDGTRTTVTVLVSLDIASLASLKTVIPVLFILVPSAFPLTHTLTHTHTHIHCPE